jgi:hypothetical protein
LATYYLSVDYRHRWATVHRAECFHPRRRLEEGGAGKISKRKRRWEWFGPFAAAEAAFKHAEQIGLKTASGCRICKP